MLDRVLKPVVKDGRATFKLGDGTGTMNGGIWMWHDDTQPRDSETLLPREHVVELVTFLRGVEDRANDGLEYRPVSTVVRFAESSLNCRGGPAAK